MGTPSSVWIRHLFGIAEAAAFLGGVASCLALIGPCHWVTDIFTHFAAILALGFAVYAGIEAIRKRRRFVIASLLLALLNAIPVLTLLFGPAEPRADRSPASPAAQRLRILQANILTSNPHAPALLALIRQEDPYVILLQETDRRWLTDLKPVFDRYPVHAAEPRDDNFGIAVFAKAPHAQATLFHLGPRPVPGGMITLPVAGRTLTCYSIHTPAPYDRQTWEERNAYTRLLAERIAANPEMKVITGDFNNTPWTRSFRDFVQRAGLCDTTRTFGILPTWPTRTLPLLRIPLDHCLHSPAVKILSKRRGPSIGSDHFPLVIDLAIEPEPSARP